MLKYFVKNKNAAKRNRELLNQKRNQCVKHKIENWYFCMDCDDVLCPDCIVIDRLHEGHKQANLKEMTKSKRKKMGEQLAHMEIIRTELQEKAQNFEKDIGEFKAKDEERIFNFTN